MEHLLRRRRRGLPDRSDLEPRKLTSLLESQFLGGFNLATFNAANILIAQTFLFPASLRQFYSPVELNRANPLRIAFGGRRRLRILRPGAKTTSLLAATRPEHRLRAPAEPRRALGRSAGTAYSSGSRRVGPLQVTPAPFPTFDARDVILDPASFQTAYVATGFRPSVFVTNNAGASWTNITGNLTTFSPGFPKHRVRPEHRHGLLVVGTNRGVFAAATDALGTWLEVGNLPNAPVLDMQYSSTQDLLDRGAARAKRLDGDGPRRRRGRESAAGRPVQGRGSRRGASCTAAVSSAEINNGSFDPDGGSVNCVINPTGPFAVGTTGVTLTCTDSAARRGPARRVSTSDPATPRPAAPPAPT